MTSQQHRNQKTQNDQYSNQNAPTNTPSNTNTKQSLPINPNPHQPPITTPLPEPQIDPPNESQETDGITEQDPDAPPPPAEIL